MSHKHHSHRHDKNYGTSAEASRVAPDQRTSHSAIELLFTIDRKGDTQNLRYGSIDKYKVPKYRAVGYGRLLGLDRRYRIVSNSGTEREIDDEAFDGSNKSHTFPLLLKRQTVDGASYPLKPELSSHNEFAEQDDYVKIGRKRRRLETRSKEQSTGLANNGHSDSVSDASDSSFDDELLQEDSKLTKFPREENTFELFRNHPDNQRQMELRKEVDQNPQDGGAWEQLIEHQERYFRLSASKAERQLNASQRRTVTDMRVSLYEKAIRSAKDQSAKERLVLGLMQEGSKIWETDKQLKEWNSILNSNHSIELWYHYLNFQQTNPIIFTYEKCLDTYLEIMKLPLTSDDESHDYHCAYLALRLTYFMFESGFVERGIAIWQALLEYNLFKPDTGDDSLEAFESFWESEQLRVGEEGARGWSCNNDQEAPTRTDPALRNLSKAAFFSNWGSAESKCCVDLVMPARTLDNTIEDDPFRVILFSDVKDFIFRVRTDQGRHYLVQGFLKFCGLAPIFYDTGRCCKWRIDPLLCDFRPDVMLGPLTDTSMLFGFGGLSTQLWNLSHCKAKGVLDFALCALTQLSESRGADGPLAEYVVALQIQTNTKSARKLAKKLLKQRSNSVRMYNTYALVEARVGKLDVAENVWSTALSMADSLGPLEKQNKILLWHSWIWELLTQARFNHALSLLTEAIPSEDVTIGLLQAVSKEHPISAGQRLRAEAYFRDQIANQVAGSCSMIMEFTALFAMLRYLSKDHDLQEVLTVYQSSLMVINQQSYPILVERVHQSRALFLQLHVDQSKSGFRPAQLLPVLEESITLFPNNSIFFSLHERYLRHAGMMDRVRLTSIEDRQSTDLFSSCLRAISKELLRPDYAGSTAHSVRRAFANATTMHSEARHCPAVWVLWIKWENSLISTQPDAQRKQIRNTYLSALRSCPWHKELYLLGFTEGSLNQALGNRELERIYRSMSERGLRIMYDISEILDDAALSQVVNSSRT